jgi:hypothetical protein
MPEENSSQTEQTLPKPAHTNASNIFTIKTEVFEGPLDLPLNTHYCEM